MKIEQFKLDKLKNLDLSNIKLGKGANLVMLFGAPEMICSAALIDNIQSAYPNACIVGCSTAGEICDTTVSDDSLVVTALALEHTRIVDSAVDISRAEDSYEKGRELGSRFSHQELRHLFVLSDGLKVNGTELVNGLTEVLPKDVRVTGGLAGDGANFRETAVCWKGAGKSGQIVAVGFYGSKFQVGYGSLGGWDTFGPRRIVTKSKNNILYEMDGQSALEIYKKYLGEHASGLPASGLLFPLSITTEGERHGLVRTILAIDEKAQSITFAGDIPQGSYAQLMKANFDRLIDGAIGAAKTSALQGNSSELAILISCVGRKMVLQQRIEEEVEGVREVLGPKTVLTGFYSYGEISPMTPNAKCELHNQTMTITTFSED